MAEYKDATDALIHALVLAVTAPTEDKSKMAVELAEQIAAGLSEHEVAQAKKQAEARVKAIDVL